MSGDFPCSFLYTPAVDAVKKILVQFVFVYLAIDMTTEIASWPPGEHRHKRHLAPRGRENNRRVELDERGVVFASMRVVTLCAGDTIIDNMNLV